MDLDAAKRRLTDLFSRDDAPTMPPADRPLVIYGAGNCGRDVLRVLREEGYAVGAFLDANATAIGSVDDVPCYLPDSRAAGELAASGFPILLAVYNFTADTGRIADALARSGFHQVLPYYAFETSFPGRVKSRFWLAPRSFWEDHKEEIMRGLDLWEDGRSREIYLDLMELRLTSNLQLLRFPDREHQYFPEDLPPLREPVRLIDAGAYNGDTLSAMRAFQMEAVAAFEPDIQNFRSLRQWVDAGGAALGHVVLYPCGVDSETAMRKFHHGEAAGSAFADAGEMIQVVALDDVLPRFAPTFVKLDIEGAEMGALEGAAGLIRSCKPRIAACVYHLPSHLWEIPFLLKKLVPEHRLYLRYHGFNGFDAVAYAVEP